MLETFFLDRSDQFKMNDCNKKNCIVFLKFFYLFLNRLIFNLFQKTCFKYDFFVLIYAFCANFDQFGIELVELCILGKNTTFYHFKEIKCFFILRKQ